MAFWCIRAGRHGESEDYALDQSVVVIGWDEAGDLSGIKSRDAMEAFAADKWPQVKDSTRRVWTGELLGFANGMKVGDLVALPLKKRWAIAFGEVVGNYEYVPDSSPGTMHQRAVRWIDIDIPRSAIPPDILASLRSSLTVFQISRNDAESRIRKLLALPSLPNRETEKSSGLVGEFASEDIDLQEYARDRIVREITRKFREHKLEVLVAEILKAQGYTVLVSDHGADGGMDILAGSGPMGFDPPRIGVQVKSQDAPVDVTVLRQLQGTMANFGATHGLLVSLGGLKSSVYREARRLYFQMRLWDQAALVDAILANYDNLSAETQAELPLQKLWTLVEDEDS